MSITPLFIIPFAIFLNKEKVSIRAVFGAFIAVAGVALLLTYPLLEAWLCKPA